MFGGAWSITPLLSLRILASHQPQPSWELLALLALLAKHDDATRSSRHVCHAPTVSAAKKGRLGSGASAAVVLQAEGPEACPVALCTHAERHGMRSFLFPKSLVRDSETRASIHKALPSRRFVHSSTTTTPLPFRKTTCSPSTTIPFSRISVSAAPFSKYPSLGENDPSAVRPTYPNAPLLAADWYLTAVAPDWHDTTRGSCRFWAQDLRLCILLITARYSHCEAPHDSRVPFRYIPSSGDLISLLYFCGFLFYLPQTQPHRLLYFEALNHAITDHTRTCQQTLVGARRFAT